MVFAICFILLHFATILLPRALLGAGWAFGAPFLEQLSCKLDPKTIAVGVKISCPSSCTFWANLSSKSPADLCEKMLRRCFAKRVQSGGACLVLLAKPCKISCH